jgi:hypothetical protein
MHVYSKDYANEIIMTNNPYTANELEKQLKASTSLVEHILIACDYFEYYVNLILTRAEGNPKILSQINCSPEQKLMYVMGIMRTFDEEDENAVSLIWGDIKQMYDLRNRLHRLNAAELDKEIRKLFKPAKDAPNYEEIISMPTLELLDFHCGGTVYWLEDYAKCADQKDSDGNSYCGLEE